MIVIVIKNESFLSKGFVTSCIIIYRLELNDMIEHLVSVNDSSFTEMTETFSL